MCVIGKSGRNVAHTGRKSSCQIPFVKFSIDMRRYQKHTLRPERHVGVHRNQILSHRRDNMQWIINLHGEHSSQRK